MPFTNHSECAEPWQCLADTDIDTNIDIISAVERLTRMTVGNYMCVVDAIQKNIPLEVLNRPAQSPPVLI